MNKEKVTRNKLQAIGQQKACNTYKIYLDLMYKQSNQKYNKLSRNILK